MSASSSVSRVNLDSAQLRALAHPVRARLLSALRAYGPDTATGLAARLQTNSGATSYHLRQLHAVGLIEEDIELSVGRQRCWRAAHEVTSWSERDFADDPDDRAALDWLLGHHVRVVSRWLQDWVDSRRHWPPEWRDAADQSDIELSLTSDALKALNEELHEVVERHRAKAITYAADVQRCAVVLLSFPMPEPKL